MPTLPFSPSRNPHYAHPQTHHTSQYEASTDVQEHEPRTDVASAEAETDLIARCEELYPGRLSALGREGRLALLDHVYRMEHGEEDEEEEENSDSLEVDSRGAPAGGFKINGEYAEEYDDEEDAEGEADDDDDDDDEADSDGGTLSIPDEGEESEEADDEVIEDMEKLQNHFPHFKEQYRLIKRIGEGTFSTVYKAEDLLYDKFDNTWDPSSSHDSRPRRHYVAIKKIYVTSSPERIYNELALLKALRNAPAVCPIITAFRHTDQVVAVLPFFKHQDFRSYFRKMTIPDVRMYMRSLLTALAAVHEQNILHRDIKPTNFLYDPDTRRGALVDFGLAEMQFTGSRPCICHEQREARRARQSASAYIQAGKMYSSGYPKADTRPSRRANRAGTRGFRAPEVLFKCTEQTTKIDIWSVGVILLTILSRRFPFFNSADDTDALIEIATIFGHKRMRGAALNHGIVFETTIPTITQSGYSLQRIVLWSTNRDHAGAPPPLLDEVQAIQFMSRCLDLDPNRRISATEALQHEFLREVDEEQMHEQGDEDEMDLLQGA